MSRGTDAKVLHSAESGEQQAASGVEKITHNTQPHAIIIFKIRTKLFAFFLVAVRSTITIMCGERWFI